MIVTGACFDTASMSLAASGLFYRCVNSRHIGSLRCASASHALFGQSGLPLCHRSHSSAPPLGLPLL